jgi:hypothetical protein
VALVEQLRPLFSMLCDEVSFGANEIIGAELVAIEVDVRDIFERYKPHFLHVPGF